MGAWSPPASSALGALIRTGALPANWSPAPYSPATGAWAPTAAPYGPKPKAAPSVPPLDSYPGVVAARNAQQSGTGQARARLAAARRAAIIKYGLNPKDEALLKKLGFALDPTDIAAAEANYASGNALLSRLDTGNTLAQTQIMNSLAARGALFSGETGYLQGQQAKAYGNQVYDAQTSLTDYLNEVLQQELDQEAAYQQAVDQALTDAWAYQQQLLAQQGSYTGGQQYLPGPS